MICECTNCVQPKKCAHELARCVKCNLAFGLTSQAPTEELKFDCKVCDQCGIAMSAMEYHAHNCKTPPPDPVEATSLYRPSEKVQEAKNELHRQFMIQLESGGGSYAIPEYLIDRLIHLVRQEKGA